MRYVFAAIFVCAIGMPAASALPAAGRPGVSASASAPIIQVAKKSKNKSSRKSSGAAGGIHPLVGSGDY